MNIVSSKKKMLLNIPSIEEDVLQKKISNFISLATILLLVCVIIVTSALIFDLVKKHNSNEYTVTYKKASEVEEPVALRIGL